MRKISWLPLFFVLLLFGSTGQAAKIMKVKEGRVLISLSQMSVKTGDVLIVISPLGESVAKIKITQVKNDRAIGEILSGNPQADLYVTKDQDLQESEVPRSSSGIVDGWYLGLGYNFAQPKLSGNVTSSSGSTETVNAVYNTGPLFVGGYETVSKNAIGFIFSVEWEPQRSISSISVTNGTATSGSSDLKVSTLGLEAGVTYGVNISELPFFVTLGVCKQSFTFTFPGASDVSGSSLGFFGGVSVALRKHYTLDVIYKSITDSSGTTGGSGTLTFSGMQLRAGYVF